MSVSSELGKRMVERLMRTQSFITPATRTVIAPVRPMTRNITRFNASAHKEFEKKTPKLNFTVAACIIAGLSNTAQGMERKRKLHMKSSSNLETQCRSLSCACLTMEAPVWWSCGLLACMVRCSTSWWWDSRTVLSSARALASTPDEVLPPLCPRLGRWPRGYWSEPHRRRLSQPLRLWAPCSRICRTELVGPTHDGADERGHRHCHRTPSVNILPSLRFFFASLFTEWSSELGNPRY